MTTAKLKILKAAKLKIALLPEEGREALGLAGVVTTLILYVAIF